MTGMPFRKIRHYTDAIEKGAPPRPDFNVRGVAFKNINAILSKQSLLDTELAVKAMPSKGDSDGKKRTLANKGTKFVNFGGTVYDPNAKYEPGKYFKHYTTNKEKFNVISGLDTTKPNWGWIDLPKKISWVEAQASLAKEPKVEVKKYKRNTKTGEIISKTGVEIKAATLGQTLSEMFPGNNLGHRAARAAGLVVDKLGKMRCPPGTPAANQFTDNMGSNCFEVSAGDIQDMLQNVSNLTNASQSINNAASSVVAANPTGTLSSIKKQAAAQLGITDLPDEFDDAISALMDARARMQAASDLRASLIDDLITQLGTTKSQFRNQDIFEALIKLQNDGLLHKDFDFLNLLMTGDAEMYMVDADAGQTVGSVDEELRRILEEINPVFGQDYDLETGLQAHEAAFLYSYLTSAHVGLTHSEAVSEVQKFLKDSPLGNADSHYTEMVKRMWDDQRGFLGSFLQSHAEDPSQSAKIMLASRFYLGNDTHAESIPLGNGEHALLHNPLNTISSPPPPEIAFDEALVFSVDPGQPGTPAEHAYAVARKVAQFQFLQAYASQNNADFINAFGKGYSDRGSQIFWHEFSHTMQWDAIEEDLRASGKILSTMSNDDIKEAMLQAVIGDFSDYDISNVAGMTMEDLITSRLDLLAGSYPASHQQAVINAYNQDGGFSAEVAKQRRLAHLETCAELYAMRKTGVISSSGVDDALEWMDRAQARPANWGNPIPQPGSSLAPELQHLINGGASPTTQPVSAVAPPTPKSVGTPRPGRGSTVARRIREGLEINELDDRIAITHGMSRSRRKNDLEQTAFITDFINSKFGKNDLEDLTNDEIVQLSDALKKEAQRLASIPEPTGADADADGIAGWKESKATAKRMNNYAEDLQDLVDLKNEVERQMGPAGPYVKTDADGKPIQRPSAYAYKPGEAFKDLTKAYEEGDFDAETYRKLAEEYKDDLTPDEYDKIMEETAYVIEPDISDDDFWGSVEADAKAEDGFGDEAEATPSKGPRKKLRKENEDAAKEPATKVPDNVDPQTGEIIQPEAEKPRVRQGRKSKIHERLVGRKMTNEDIQKEMDGINQKVNGGGSGRFGGPVNALNPIKQYCEDNFDTSDLRELDEDQLRQLKGAMKELATSLSNTPIPKQDAGKYDHRIDGKITDATKKRSQGQTLNRFLSSLDDMADLKDVKENGFDVMPEEKPMWDLGKDFPRVQPFREGGLASRKHNTSARVHSTRLQRSATPQEARALNDTFDSPNPFGGLVGDDSSVSSAVRDSAERRRILTDAGIVGGPDRKVYEPSTTQNEKFKPLEGLKSMSVRKASTPKSEDKYGGTSWTSADIYKIDDKNVVFGVDDKVNLEGEEDVTRVPINPFSISGLDKTSPKGRETSIKWAQAHAAHLDKEGSSSTYVDALLYAGTRGDKDAMDEFESLAKEGERLVAEQKKNAFRRPINPETELEMRRDKVDNLKIDELFLVHETSYEPKYDDSGSLILHPLSHYEQKDKDGNKILNDDGTDYKVERGTIHFALNHLVAGNLGRGEVGEGSHIIIIPLSDILKANPGSLDNLYAVDTFLTPPPGEPLKLPKDKLKIVRGGEKSRDEVESTLKEMGARSIFAGGGHYSTTGVDTAVSNFAADMGVESGLHQNLPHSKYELMEKGSEMYIGVRELASMSTNAQMRIADNERFTGARKEIDNSSMGLFSKKSPSSMTSNRSLSDGNVEKFLVPTLDLMEKNPTTADMQIEVELDDETLGKLSALNGVSNSITIEHDGFIDGTPSDRTHFPQKSTVERNEQNRSVVIHIPKGARALSKGGARDEKSKVKLPPGKLQFDGVTADGKPIARVVEQRTGEEILNTIERKTQKMSEGLRSDEKREAAKLIDATRKAQQQRKDRGDVNVGDIKSMAIAKRNESITGDIRNSGSSPFRPEVVAEREKEAFQNANSSLGTTLDLPAEERHLSYLDRSSQILKLMRGKDTAVRENMLPVSPAVKKALEIYSDDELNDMASTVSKMIDNGFDKRLVIPISDLSDVSGNGIRRPKDSDSVEMMRDDVDMLAGFGSNMNKDNKPVRAMVRHKDHERQSVESLVGRNAVNGQADFYSESDAVNAVLRPEVSTRSGYGHKDFVDRDSSFVSMNKPDRQSVDLAIADSSKDSDKDEVKVSRMDSLLSAAISGNYSEIVGTKDNPSMQALIPGGVKPQEIDHIEYPLSKIKLDSESINPNDPVLGKNSVTDKLQKMGLTDSEIQVFFNMGGAVGGGATPSFATRLMQYRGAQQVKNDMRQQGFDKIRFTNPEGLDIMNPTTWQTRLNARKESPHELLKVLAGKEIDNYLKTSAEKIKKNRGRKTT